MTSDIIELDTWQRACSNLGSEVAAVSLMLRNAARGTKADENNVCVNLCAMRELREVHSANHDAHQLKLLIDAFVTLCIVAITRLKARATSASSGGPARCSVAISICLRKCLTTSAK